MNGSLTIYASCKISIMFVSVIEVAPLIPMFQRRKFWRDKHRRKKRLSMQNNKKIYKNRDSEGIGGNVDLIYISKM